MSALERPRLHSVFYANQGCCIERFCLQTNKQTKIQKERERERERERKASRVST